MTIPASSRKSGPYPGNSAQDEFAFNFKVFEEADVAVLHAVTATGVEVTLVLDSDYSIALNADQEATPGGVVTYPLAGDLLPSTETITIIGSMAYSQPSDIPDGGDFNASNIESAVDRQNILIQQLNEKISRAVLVTASSDDDPQQLVADLLAATGEATTAAGAASASAAAAAASETAAGVSEDAAAASAAAAAASETAAGVSETNAAASESAAAASASAASTSAGTATTQAGNASTSAGAAATEAGNAAASAVAADASADAAALSETAAAASAASAAANAYNASVQDFRLTLTTAVPVTTSDVTGATTIYCSPFRGSYIDLYDGASWNRRQSAEFSLALGTLTSGRPYDIFCYDNASVPTLEFLSWTNDTTRATALARQDGVLVKSGDATRRYLGTFYTTSTTQTEDSVSKRYLFNYYHRIARGLLRNEPATNWSYATNTWRQANGNTANKVEWVCGVAEDIVDVYVQGGSAATVGGGVVGVGIDSVTVDSSSLNLMNSSNSDAEWITICASYRGIPSGVGRHYAAWLEAGQNSGAISWRGTEINSGIPNFRNGMIATVMA